MNTGRLYLAVAVACGFLVAATAVAQTPTYDKRNVPAEGRRFALLVGCTKYPALGPRYTLQGPANDVALFDRLLRDRFHFNADQITRLVNTNPIDGRPTYANIVRELDRLVAAAREGDEVCILLSGHGSQQPDGPSGTSPSTTTPAATGGDIAGDEDDGLDEVFLPEDVRAPLAGGDPLKDLVPGLTDDRLEHWLAALVERGARVWFVVDTCHSGTMSRAGAEEEEGTYRFVPPEVLATPEELRAATELAAGRSVAAAKPQANSDMVVKVDAKANGARGALAAIYAVPPYALEREQPMPPVGGARNDPRYGRLCYAVNQVLLQSPSPLSYRELAEQVARQYRSWSWFPAPVFEVATLDREVLGRHEWSERAALLVSRTDNGALELNQGLAHGLTVGSVVKLVPGDEAKSNAATIYLRVAIATPLTARVDPTAHGDLPAASAEKLIVPSRCEVVEVDLGKLQLSVSVVGPESAATEVARVRKLVADLAARKDSVVRPATSDEVPDVVLRVGPNEVTLQRRGDTDVEAATPADTKKPRPAHFGPYPLDDQLRASVTRDLRQIALVRNLFRLADVQEPKDPNRSKIAFGLAVEVERLPAGEEIYTSLDFTSPRFAAGDTLRVRLRNTGTAPLDATVLYVDSRLSITSHYPTLRAARAGTYNTLESRAVREVTIKINDSTVGPEDVLVFAVAHRPPISAHFAFLEQPGLTRADLRTERGGGTSPLDDLLGASLGGSRASKREDEQPTFAIRRIPIEVVGRDPPAAADAKPRE